MSIDEKDDRMMLICAQEKHVRYQSIIFANQHIYVLRFSNQHVCGLTIFQSEEFWSVCRSRKFPGLVFEAKRW